MSQLIPPSIKGSAKEPKILYCLDFDGVLCDSVQETFLSGWRACQLLWNNSNDCEWMNRLEKDVEQMNELEEDFRFVRPILYVGWEAILLIRLLAVGYQQEIAGTDLDVESPLSTRDAVFRGFHNATVERDFRDHALQSWGLDASDYSDAMAKARNTWIQQDEASWIDAHGFYKNACQAVKAYLESMGNENVYVITTKAKEFALRLLEKQDLFLSSSDSTTSTMREDQIFGLGSGPKASVIQLILQDRQKTSPETDFMAVMVEDNIGTLDKISKSSVGDRVLPVVASWGYNSVQQLIGVLEKQNTSNGDKSSYVVLPRLKNSFDDITQHAETLKQGDPTGASLKDILKHDNVLSSC